MTKNDREKAEFLGKFYSSVFTNETDNGDRFVVTNPNISHELNIKISKEVVQKKL